MKRLRCLVLLAAALVWTACSEQSDPTAPSLDFTQSINDPHSSNPASGQLTTLGSAESLSDETLSCGLFEDARIRFSAPGFINFENVGMYLMLRGMSDGRKRVRLWWDWDNAPNTYTDLILEENDFNDLLEHRYDALQRKSNKKVRIEVTSDAEEGHCVRVRHITVEPEVKVTAAAPAPPPAITSCLDILNAGLSTGDGNYTFDPDGGGPVAPLTAYCDMTTDGGGYTYYPINGTGISTTRYDQPNSCQAVGMEIAVPRTQAHLVAMDALYPIATYFRTAPGVYSPTNGGNYTGCAMNSGSAGLSCPSLFDWVSIDGGSFWIRGTSISEPNGDYTAGCWLGMWAPAANPWFNDGWCGYPTGTSYVCSTNDK